MGVYLSVRCPKSKFPTVIIKFKEHEFIFHVIEGLSLSTASKSSYFPLFGFYPPVNQISQCMISSVAWVRVCMQNKKV